MHIFLETLGCRLNEAELETWERQFRELGCRLTNDAGDADVVVVNTCAVTEEAARKSRKLLRRAQRLNPRARLVVTGCLATLQHKEIASLGVPLVIGNQDKDRLVEITHRELGLTDTDSHPDTDSTGSGQIPRNRHRGFVKIQDGCRYRCAFCIVTLARGEERSRPAREIIDEINQLHERGVQEIVLTGVHIGGYGTDLGTNLARLLESILRDTEIPRLRLGSLEPWELHAGLWPLFETRRLLPHLHLPLQSGADSVLRRMSRRCRSEAYADLVQQARLHIPDCNITTDIIVGFPGETEEEWRQTVEFVQRIGFGHLHIFGFSPRTGTRAATFSDQINPDVKRLRSQQLHGIAKREKAKHLASYLGRRFPVLFEGPQESADPNGRRWGGYTPNFLRVSVPYAEEPGLANQIRNVRLRRLAENGEAIEGDLD